MSGPGGGLPDGRQGNAAAGSGGRPGEQGAEQGSAGSPLAGLSKGLPGGNQAGRPDAPKAAPRDERGSDLAGPDAPTTAMSVPGRNPATERGGSADDRTVKMGGAQAKSTQADVPTAGMTRADLAAATDAKFDNASAPSSTTAGSAVAGAAAAGAVAAGAAAVAGATATGSGSDETSKAQGSKPNADGGSDTRAKDGDNPERATEDGAAESDSTAATDTGKTSDPTASPTAEHGDPTTEADAAGPEADAAGPEAGAAGPAAGAVAGEGDSRGVKAADVDATEKFKTAGAKGEGPASEDQTVAMRVVSSADAPTTAMPVQRAKTAGQAGTDRVVPPAGGRPAMTPPPNTPRGPAGPRQAGQPGPGQQGPAGPGQHPAGPGPAGHGQHGPGQQGTVRGQQGPGQDGPAGPRPGQQGVEETQPSPPRGPGAPLRKEGSAPSPADIQPTRPAQQLADGQRAVAPPQRIGVQPGEDAGAPGAKRSKKWLLAAGGAAVLVVALIATVVALMGGADDSPEGQVKAVIGDYTDALRSGDLEDLRASTCGELHAFYQGITPEQFKGVHEVSTERGSIPVVDSVDAVRITGDTALAQATVYTSADPSKRTARTFDLQRTDGSWKVCDPAGTP